MRFYLLSMGCPKNTVDSESICRELVSNGHNQVSESSAADIILVNTCGFIAPAEAESRNALLQLAASKQGEQKLVSVGCLSERRPQELKEAIPEIDLMLGTYKPGSLPRQLESWQNGLQSIPQVPKSPSMPRPSAYIKIADGCSAACAFCVIPQIKGPYHSAPEDDIISEAQRCVDEGTREIVLVAQDTTAYGLELGQREGLARLLKQLTRSVRALPWIRIMYAHPAHVTPEFIETMARLPQVCHYLDIPLQHAHPDVLRRMRRPADMGRVHSLISDLRDAMPDIALRTSIIVGYPGETEDEFQSLLDFAKDVRFERLGVFKYYREESTEAAELPDQVPEPVKEERFHRLMALQQEISLELNQELIGQEMEVLVESLPDTEDVSYIVARSYRDAPEVDGLVLLEGNASPGDLVKVRIMAALEYDLIAELL